MSAAHYIGLYILTFQNPHVFGYEFICVYLN